MADEFGGWVKCSWMKDRRLREKDDGASVRVACMRERPPSSLHSSLALIDTSQTPLESNPTPLAPDLAELEMLLPVYTGSLPALTPVLPLHKMQIPARTALVPVFTGHLPGFTTRLPVFTGRLPLFIAWIPSAEMRIPALAEDITLAEGRRATLARR